MLPYSLCVALLSLMEEENYENLVFDDVEEEEGEEERGRNEQPAQAQARVRGRRGPDIEWHPVEEYATEEDFKESEEIEELLQMNIKRKTSTTAGEQEIYACKYARKAGYLR